MLKYVVPLYLAVIGVAFCWNNLPSTEEAKFTADAQFMAIVEEGELNDAARERFRQEDLLLPNDIRLERGTGGEWRLVDAEQQTHFVVREVDGKPSVFAYNMGYAERIRTDEVVFSSVMFILTVFLFLLILVHIAGKRWIAAGKFDHLEA
jgi:hypothetical protein